MQFLKLVLVAVAAVGVTAMPLPSAADAVADKVASAYSTLMCYRAVASTLGRC
ncbi:hypothetical protein BJ875DRAFT_488572 [Amylocarpus encephaloides]|uniref:Uncharacterized protein n=1 Tax=Amylocarpus encephaloides TaxID=45428 RepID=A0A9P8C1E8_9HELO|nr:hypothetical protein BJ875DRAFT_488572 [Amylocarpus encephaloides]